MTDPSRSGKQALSAKEKEERRRRLARVFGDVLPEQTRDDVEGDISSSGDDWLRRQVPPHHG